MSNFFNGMNVKLTQNGDKAFATTTNKVLDFFAFTCPHVKMNEKNKEEYKKAIQKAFISALLENPELAIRTLLFRYDVREGQGERFLFKACLEVIMRDKVECLNYFKFLNKIVEIGRYDMLLEVLNFTEDEFMITGVLSRVEKALKNLDTAALMAKWLPRKGALANRVRGWLRVDENGCLTDSKHGHKPTPKEYRKILAGHVTTETLMSSQRWNLISYEHVPSVCMNRNSKLFRKHDEERFEAYGKAVASGEKKINAKVLYPHDCIRLVFNESERDIAEGQWKALPDLFNGNTLNAIPMIDVSGSMMTSIGSGVTARDVAYGLGMYIAERNHSVFQDEVITFSEHPEFVKINQEHIWDRIRVLANTQDPYNTDFAKAFMEILKRAQMNNLSQEDMPEALFVLSDMQFDCCISCAGCYAGDNAVKKQLTSLELMKQKFEEAGYKMPTMILWNLSGTGASFPTTSVENGMILISGFSPSVLKALFNGEDLTQFTPEKYLLDLVMVDRYNVFH